MSKEPFLPELFMPFYSNSYRLTTSQSGDNLDTNVVIGDLVIPSFVQNRDQLRINVGALCSFAAQCDIGTLYVMNNPNDEGAQQTFHIRDGIPGAISDRRTKWFSSSIEKGTRKPKSLDVLAMYFNSVTASQVVIDHAPFDLTNNITFWAQLLDKNLRNGLATSGATANHPFQVNRRLRATTFVTWSSLPRLFFFNFSQITSDDLADSRDKSPTD